MKWFCCLLLLWLLGSSSSGVYAQNATPEVEGQHLVVAVQAGDSLWGLSARHGINFYDLLAFNNLTEESVIQPGQRLIVGKIAATATPAVVAPPAVVETAVSEPSAATLVPTAAVASTTGQICFFVFTDMNENGVHDAGEPPQANVVIIVHRGEEKVAAEQTDGRLEPRCVTELRPATYRVERLLVGAKDRLTTASQYQGELTAGQKVMLYFGSVAGGEETAVVSQTPTTIVRRTSTGANLIATATVALVTLLLVQIYINDRRGGYF